MPTLITGHVPKRELYAWRVADLSAPFWIAHRGTANVVRRAP